MRRPLSRRLSRGICILAPGFVFVDLARGDLRHLIAAPITSAGRFSPLGPRGFGLLLLWRTRNVSVSAKDAAISAKRLQVSPAPFAIVEVHACVHGHRERFPVSALRTRNRGLTDHCARPAFCAKPCEAPASQPGLNRKWFRTQTVPNAWRCPSWKSGDLITSQQG